MRERDWVDTMQVCVKGHKITSFLEDSPEDGRAYCEQCGSKTISRCPKCGVKIPGFKHLFGVAYPDSTAPPDFCSSCGENMPWKTQEQPPLIVASPSAESRAVRIFERFHSAAVHLRTRRESRPPLLIEDEYDFQYLFGALLRLEFDDIRPEEYTPSYAGGSSRIDYILPAEQLAIELKRTRESLKDKKVGEELIVDTSRYATNTKIKTLLSLVYDPDHLIKNPSGLVTDVEQLSTAALKVRLVIRPIP